MTVFSVLELLASYLTRVVIRDNDFHVLATGFRSSVDIECYLLYAVTSFTWQDDNTLFIDIEDAREING